MTRHVVVTGTDTDVGKTVATAALAVVLGLDGSRVAVVKPVQTGVGRDDPGDLDEVTRLTGLTDVHEHVRLGAALAPESAALVEGRALPTVAEHAVRIRALDADVVVVEGAGGLLVRLDLDAGTVLDLAVALEAEVVVVTREGLGTLNHTQLTVDRLRDAGIEPRLVLGSCSPTPDVAAARNHVDLPRLTGAPVLARIPEGAGALDRDRFCAQAPAWFGPGRVSPGSTAPR